MYQQIGMNTTIIIDYKKYWFCHIIQRSFCCFFCFPLHAFSRKAGEVGYWLLEVTPQRPPLKTFDIRTVEPLKNTDRTHLLELKNTPPCLAQSHFPNRRISAGCPRPIIHNRTAVGRRHAEPSSRRIFISMPLSGSGKRWSPLTSSRNSQKQTCSSRV